jgi:hypothetical protein
LMLSPTYLKSPIDDIILPAPIADGCDVGDVLAALGVDASAPAFR